MALNPLDEIYFVNWDDYGKHHVVYRIRLEFGTHVSEFLRTSAWIQDQYIYRSYVNGIDPTGERITKIQALKIMANSI